MEENSQLMFNVNQKFQWTRFIFLQPRRCASLIDLAKFRNVYYDDLCRLSVFEVAYYLGLPLEFETEVE